MGLWICPVHGLVGTMACCRQSSFARVAQAEARVSNVPSETVSASLIEVEERSLCKRTVEGSSPSSGSLTARETSGENHAD